MRRAKPTRSSRSNMKQIAKKAGVSLGTVSHVLNNTARVSEPLRKSVLDAVAALGYQPSQLARGLRRDRTDMVGMIIPDVTNPFFTAVVRGAEDVAFAQGHRLILCNTDNDHDKELVHLNALRTYLPAGLLVIPSSFSDLTTQAESYRNAGAAVVCIRSLAQELEGRCCHGCKRRGCIRRDKLPDTTSPSKARNDRWPAPPDQRTRSRKGVQARGEGSKIESLAQVHS